MYSVLLYCHILYAEYDIVHLNSFVASSYSLGENICWKYGLKKTNVWRNKCSGFFSSGTEILQMVQLVHMALSAPVCSRHFYSHLRWGRWTHGPALLTLIPGGKFIRSDQKNFSRLLHFYVDLFRWCQLRVYFKNIIEKIYTNKQSQPFPSCEHVLLRQPQHLRKVLHLHQQRARFP